ncbi:MAG: hypothetical protein M1132_03455, partial [Chloroflexi bacterium]|nr:hypothetical protein [Chloroflexota bacterium]
VDRIIGRSRTLSKSFRQAGIWSSARTLRRLLFWVGTPIKLAGLFLACGFILGFLDPSLDLTQVDSWLLILALAISIGLVVVSVLAAQQLVLRTNGNQADRPIGIGHILLVLATTVLSRLAGLVPGILLAGPTRLEQNPDIQVKLDRMAVGAMILVGLAAWVVAPLVDTDAWFKTVALLTFATAVQTLFLQMLPLKNLHGRSLFESSRPAWFVLFILIALVLLETMLNPDGSFIAAFQSPTMLLLALAAVAFSITSVILTLYAHRQRPVNRWQSRDA